jgi:hypothetical protein
MNFQKIRIILSTLILIFIGSNIYIIINQPLVYAGGCDEEEFQSILFISESYNSSDNFFSDLRIGSVIRKYTSVCVIDAYGGISSSQSELNITYSIYYSGDSDTAYSACISLFNNFIAKNPQSRSLFIFMSKNYIKEGIHTMDYAFGPISEKNYENFLTDNRFRVVYQNTGSYIIQVIF